MERRMIYLDDAIRTVESFYRISEDIRRKMAFELRQLSSAQPERLTDDDFETIRIHLNAYKEKLCNQKRWEEADEYQRIIDRFMAFASAQPSYSCSHENDTVSRQNVIGRVTDDKR